MDDVQDPNGHGEYAMGEKSRYPQQGRKPLQCWRCVGPRLRWIFPHGEGYVRPTYNIQGHGTEAVEKWEHESSPDAAATI